MIAFLPLLSLAPVARHFESGKWKKESYFTSEQVCTEDKQALSCIGSRVEKENPRVSVLERNEGPSISNRGRTFLAESFSEVSVGSDRDSTSRFAVTRNIFSSHL